MKRVHAWTLLPWVDSNHRPHSPQELVLNRLFYWDDLLLSNALPTELYGNVKRARPSQAVLKKAYVTKKLSPLCVLRAWDRQWCVGFSDIPQVALESFQSGEAYRAFSGISVSVKPVCLRL